MSTPETKQRYAYWRGHGLPPSAALSYARTEQQYARTLERFGPWFGGSSPDERPYGAFATAELDAAPAGYSVRVVIGDDDAPYDWGDVEPTDDERDNVRAFYVAVQVLDADGHEVYHDGIGGVDAIDLPGYMQRTWKDAAAYALTEYLLGPAEAWLNNETTERAHWAARDTITV